MKRKNYIIYLNDSKLTIKHAYNSALRAVRKSVQENANSHGAKYQLTMQRRERDGCNTTWGRQIWQSDSAGPLVYTIYLDYS